jgi:hypothetical protein
MRARLAVVPALLALAAVGAGARAAHAAVTWCGTGPSPENRAPDVEASSFDQVHVIYATPADGPDQFAALASPVASDVAAIDGWWRGQDSSRTPRFDLFAFPGCAPGFGMLDLGYLRLSGTAASYADDAGRQRLADDVGAAAGSNVKTLVYYDGSADDPNLCGITSGSPSRGGQSGVSIVYLKSACDVDVGQGRATALVAAHELIHNLGAVPDSGPPHECPPPNEGHVCDNATDVMYPYYTGEVTLASAVLDIGRDDYYGHSGSWWDVQDSGWLEHLPQFELGLAVAASGHGTVATFPRAVVCPSQCTSVWDNGTQVSVDAQPSPGWRLVAWGGSCSGSDDCTVTMDAAKSVTATFGPATFRISVSVAGKGTVTSAPRGLACARVCARSFAFGSTVRLTAHPARGYRFSGWTGACVGRRGCTFRVDRVRSVRARFVSG